MRPSGQMVLLERDAELARADQMLADAVRRRGGVLRVLGPAGIGKTALLDVIAQRAADRAMTVVSASGAPLTRTVSFGTVRQLFSRGLVGLTAADRAAVFVGAARLAESAVSGSVERHYGADAHSGADVAFAHQHGLYWLTANLASRRPLVIVVDDLQWIDAPSLAYLTHLAERIDGLPLLLVVAAREEVGDEAATGLPGSALHLAALSAAGVAGVLCTQLGREPDADTLARAVRVSAGNPFQLGELARAPGAAGGRSDAEPVVDGLSERVRGLDGDARALADALAVLGAGTGVEQLADLAGLSVDRAAAAAARLIEAHVVDVGDGLRFAHPLVHAAVEVQLDDAARCRLHADAARLLAPGGADPELVAVHVLASRPERDAWAVGLLRVAAAAVLARGAPERAAQLYEQASALVPGGPDAELLAELGTAQASAGASEQAVSTLRRALAATREPARRAAIARSLAAQLTRHTAHAAEAVAVLDSALADLPPDAAALGLRLEADIETAAFVSLDARRIARRRVPSGFADPRARQIRAAAAMSSAMQTGPAAVSAELARQALDGGRLLAEESAESPTFWLATLALIFAQDLVTADAVLAAARADAAARGSRVAAGMVCCFRARLHLQLGRVADAESDARRFLELTPTAFTLGPAFLIDALLERGELDEARRLVAEAGEPDLDSAMAHFLLLSRAALRLTDGDLTGAERDLNTLADSARAWETLTPGPLPWQPILAEVLLRRGARAQAREVIDAHLQACRDFGADTCTGAALRTAALLAGDHGERVRLAAESVALLADSPARLEHARSLVALGEAHLARGDRLDARAPLRDGLRSARGCGATVLALRAHALLAQAGVRTRKIVQAGADALTGSERRVCVLAAHGLSNREIAEHLFVTARTVETHLDRSYQKLGVHARVELAGALRRDS